MPWVVQAGKAMPGELWCVDAEVFEEFSSDDREAAFAKWDALDADAMTSAFGERTTKLLFKLDDRGGLVEGTFRAMDYLSAGQDVLLSFALEESGREAALARVAAEDVEDAIELFESEIGGLAACEGGVAAYGPSGGSATVRIDVPDGPDREEERVVVGRLLIPALLGPDGLTAVELEAALGALGVDAPLQKARYWLRKAVADGRVAVRSRGLYCSAAAAPEARRWATVADVVSANGLSAAAVSAIVRTRPDCF